MTTQTPAAINYSRYDYTILVDLSGSMSLPVGSPEEGVPEDKTPRIEAAKAFISSFVSFIDAYDQDGISVGFFGNGKAELYENVGKAKLDEVLAKARPEGNTPLHLALEKALQPQATEKPEVIFIITDGEPSDRTAVVNQLINAANSISEDEKLAVSFIQVGYDSSAATFLQSLDNDLKSKGARFDIVDTKEMRQVDTPEAAIWAALND